MTDIRSPHLLAACCVLQLAAASLVADTTDEVHQQFWRDPGFVAEFMGSYGVKSAIEPSLNADEQLFYQELAGIIQTDRAAAIERVTAFIRDGKAEVVVPEPESPDGKSRRKSGGEKREVKLTNLASFEFTLGNLQVQEGQIEAAEASYRRAIEKFPDFQRAHKNLGVILVQGGKFDEALKSLVRTLELGGSDANLYGLLGACYLSTEQYRSAELAYNQAMVLAPTKKDWRLGASRALLYQRRYQEASALFSELIAAEPKTAQYWLFQANCYIGLNEPMKAAFNYEVVREMGLAEATTLTALGDIYLSKDLRDLAFGAYLAALEKDPKANLERSVKSAEVLAGRRAVEQSGRLISKIRELAGAELAGALQLRLLRLESKLALADGEDAAAAKVMEEVLILDPLDGEIMLLLAGFYGKAGDVPRAEALFERAAKLEGREAEARVKHAQLLAKNKFYARAIELLKRAQELEPKENVQRYLDGLERLAAASRG
jgi:tetratricopeptide (TPR) repeat protein